MSPSAFVTRSLLALFLSTAVSLPAMAQGVGAIGGTVMDSTGAVLPGAIVRLSSAQGGIGSNQEAISDQRGDYQFLRLVPGTYSVDATLQGFRPVKQPDIVVNSDTTSRADLRLEIGAVEEGIIVSGTPPQLDTTTVLKMTVLSREELQALPNRTDVWSIVRVVPSIMVSKIDVGGTERFLQSNLTVRGSAIENKYMIDSMDVSGPSGTGATSLLYFDPFVYEQSTFQVAANSAEHSIGGLSVNMVTRSGTNQFRGGAMISYTPPAWARSQNYSPELRLQLIANVPAQVLAANPDVQPQADLLRMRDTGAWLGGPIVRDKLWFASTFSDQRMDRYKLGSYLLDGTPVIDDNIMWTTTNKASWQATKTGQLSYFHNLQYKLIGHRGGGTFADERARQYSTKYPTVNQIKFTSQPHATMVLDVAYNRVLADDVFGTRPEVKTGDVAKFDTTTQFSAVALPVYNLNTTRKHQIKGGLSWFRTSHETKMGIEAMRVARGVKEWSTSGMRGLFANGVPSGVNTYLVPIQTKDGIQPDDIDIFYEWVENTYGVYVQHKWTPHKKLALNMGVRYETSTSFEPPACRPDTQFFPGACYGKVTTPMFKDFAPRFNMVYDLKGDGRTALKFAANRYNQQMGVSLITQLAPIVAGGVFDQRQWLPQSQCNNPGVLGCDRNGDLIPQLNEIWTVARYVIPGVSSRYADGLARPVSNEFSADLQHELPQGIVASVGVVYRQTRRNIANENTATPTSAWIGPLNVVEVTSGEAVQVWRRPSNASANLYYNSEDLNTNYKGMDITLDKRMSRRWSMRGGATFGVVRAASRGGDRSNPNITSAFDSNILTPDDRPWSYRASGVYELPRGVFLSGTWQYQSGAPETTVVLVTSQTIALPQGNQSVQIAPVGDVRYPNLAQLDFNIRKVWRFAGGKSLAPRLNIFNATNSATLDAWVVQRGPAYHRASNLQRGRLVNFDISYEF